MFGVAVSGRFLCSRSFACNTDQADSLFFDRVLYSSFGPLFQLLPVKVQILLIFTSNYYVFSRVLLSMGIARLTDQAY
jgi:hypothetical protein